jgi:anhydro-N-acetylmuramic acid kinase
MNYIGLMSGTSLDGVDAVIYDVNNHTLLASEFLAYSLELKKDCYALMQSEYVSFKQIAKLENDLAELYLLAVEKLKKKSALKAEIKAIGCHGQTIIHAIDNVPPYSIQLGNSFLLASKSGLPVVSHFRQKDLVLGGQGAPLAPLFHRSLFQLTEEKVVVNIGGIANISYVDKEKNIRGFDTGPGNVLLDAWIKKNKNKAFDEGGSWALEGDISLDLLNALMDDSYFSYLGPKSLDKHYFSLDWLNNHMQIKSLAPQDIQATLAAFTIETIVVAIKKVAPLANTLIVCGGGARNQILMNGFEKQFEGVESSDALGYDSDYIEAMMVAWYADKCFNGEKIDLGTVTGSARSSVHGAIVYP